MSIEFIRKESLSKEELKNYEEAIALIKNKKNPYTKKPSKVAEKVSRYINSFDIPMHTKCWKYYKVRPQKIVLGHENEYCGYVEGFDGYLYTKSWVDFLIKKLADQNEFEKVRSFSVH